MNFSHRSLNKQTNPTTRKALANYMCHYSDDSNYTFPFENNRFDTVVLRFPKAMPDYNFRHIIAECMRVLCPLGFLEISCVEIDLSNVGPYTRRATRSLKQEMQKINPSVSLRPFSDTIQVMLGHYGFDNLRRCSIRLPCKEGETHKGPDPSDELELVLEELLDDPSSQGDVIIFRMIAQVARFLHSSSYNTRETASGISNVTVWDDDKITEECDRMGTKVTLFLCHAQKPKAGRRIAMSW